VPATLAFFELGWENGAGGLGSRKTKVLVWQAVNLLASGACGATLNYLLSSGKSHLLGVTVGVAIALIALVLRYPASTVPMTVATIILFCAVFAYVLSSTKH